MIGYISPVSLQAQVLLAVRCSLRALLWPEAHW
jgi:hypothetical protein